MILTKAFLWAFVWLGLWNLLNLTYRKVSADRTPYKYLTMIIISAIAAVILMLEH